MSGEIRPLVASDWEQVWGFFSAIVADGETYAYPPDLSSGEAQELWCEPPPGLAVVWTDGDRVGGTAKMGPNRPGRGSHVGTASFMVDPGRRGQGVGRALAEWTIGWHREQGFRAIQFNAVVETNLAAVALWRDLGFEIIGTVPCAFDSARHGLVGLHIMYLDLA